VHVTEMDVIVATPDRVSVTPPTVDWNRAEISACPFATGVTRPAESTVATAVFDEDQAVPLRVTSSVVEFEKFAMAVQA